MYTPKRRVPCLALLMVLLVASSSLGQTETATLSGRVTDPKGAIVPGAFVELTNIETGIKAVTTTNDDGLYVVPSLRPGRYRVIVRKEGFKEIVKTDVVLHVQEISALNFSLEVGSVTQSVTVTGGVPLINRESGAVSTVVDRRFVENMPLNGRSFQTLIQLTPGVVLTANNGLDTGQFSINGQRASSNYLMVDGVSANIGISVGATPGNGLGGALGSYSVLGSTNSLVSVDATQEFRIQTSTYAPEFGRTPGGQISIATRSGTNQLHGTLFDYLRNDVLDANDWFANANRLPKPKERQNDFGGTLSAPILKDKTFFFFSYEGLRLRLPQTALTNVPDLTARQNATPTMQPFLNAYPLPNGPDNLATGIAQFNKGFSNPATLDAYSLRIDHKLNDRISVFGRYNHSPSELIQRVASPFSLSVVFPQKITTQTATAGMTWSISPAAANDLRFNYSSTDSSSSVYLDNFGGAVPFVSLPIPSPFTAQIATFGFRILSLGSTAGALLSVGKISHNQQRQINLVDSVSLQKGSHGMKFGIDLRRLSPQFAGAAYSQTALFNGVSEAETGNLRSTNLFSTRNVTFLFRNLSLFAQDTWRIVPHLILTYGLRWDVDLVPSSIDGPSLAAVTGFNIHDLSQLALAPAGTPAFRTKYGNPAPRVGIAYQFSQSQDWQAVLRGGFGVFYDLATAEVGNNTNTTFYPFGAFKSVAGGTFPLASATAAPPAIAPPNATSGTLFAFDPNLQLPYTLQWNVALEQALGRQQTISASYIGSAGRRLIQTALIASPSPNYARAQLVTNGATSNYNAVQLQFQRRLSQGLQALASYTWSHSIDTGSAGSLGNRANALVPTINVNTNRGPSDFDIRAAFSVGLTYDVPSPKANAFTNAILRGWSLQDLIQARSAPPINVYDSLVGLSFQTLFGASALVRPDVVPGQPIYLFGPQYAGGKALNPAAFTNPPVDPTTQLPTRQGNLSRNALRGLGAIQWDFAVHRDFPIHESLKLQFRAEMFNVLNHPNFAPPVADLLSSQFGQSTQMLGQSLSGGQLGAGAFSPLYQIGGPRSIQFALKLSF